MIAVAEVLVYPSVANVVAEVLVHPFVAAEFITMLAKISASSKDQAVAALLVVAMATYATLLAL